MGTAEWSRQRPVRRRSGLGTVRSAENFNNPQVFDLVYTHKFNDRLNYTLDTLFAYQTNVLDTGTATWFGVVNYLTYALVPRLSGTARLECFDDCQGQRTGFEGLYTALTTGVTFKATRCVILRPEVRYDFNIDSRPFEGKHGLWSATMDVIFRW